ncbi:MAG: 2-amino-4-hydroxy-6-hydroxymethyldihydropteridine diphosphokinase [Chloroflexi bacterium]|nr:2-amino-4-hydroxy-6-hydroxymethyldihydropteridine diphosphokinase [Chloroflexota bacterium]
MFSEVYLGLGSNLGDREENIARALASLRQISTSLTASSLYETTPQGFRDQPPFLNAVCRLWTRLDPFQLLRETQRIESEIGRRRTFVNAPRVLDIDILLYGTLSLRSPHLTIPHPRMAERAFVLEPLAEIAPQLRHPVLGATMRSLLARLPETRRS